MTLRNGLAPVLVVFFSFLAPEARSDESPLFAVDPTGATLRLLAGYPSGWQSRQVQAGRVVKEVDPFLPSCLVDASDGDIHEGRVLPVREVSAAEEISSSGGKEWTTTITTGTRSNQEWKLTCVPPKGQSTELTIQQLHQTIQGLLAFEGYRLRPYSLDTTDTFSELPQNSALFFKSPFATQDQHITFQNGRRVSQWEAGPHCYVNGFYAGYRVAQNRAYPLNRLAFSYTHTESLTYNTHAFYSLHLKDPAGEVYSFECASSDPFRRPSRTDFSKAVGDLVLVR